MTEKKATGRGKNPNSLANLTQNRKDGKKIISESAKARTKKKAESLKDVEKTIETMFSGDSADWGEILRKVLIKVGKEKGEDLFTNIVKRAYTNKDIAMGLMRKVMPDLQKNINTETRQLIVLRIKDSEKAEIPAHMRGFLKKEEEPEVTYLPAVQAEEKPVEH
jgi:hypothetical protein